MKQLILFFTFLFFLTCGGYAYVSIPLVQQNKPLKEKTLQGRGKNKILLIDISGIITGEAKKSLTGIGTEPGHVLRIKEELEKALKDKNVKAIILRIDSPGGTVTACDIIYHEIKNLKKKRDIFVAASFLNIAASGGLYIANAADTIIAHPTTVTGSIGVIAVKFNVKGLMDKLGIEEESIKSGDKKDIFSPFRGITDEEKKIMQAIIDNLYQKFLTVVDEGRKELSRKEIEPLADGRIFTADQALEHKLVDGIGYLDDVITITKKKLGIKDARVIMYHRPMDYKNNIYSQSTFNLINLGGVNIMEHFPMSFMYLWNP